MPNQFGFDEIPRNGSVQLHCIWCDMRPRGRMSDRAMRSHERRHRKDAARAAEASKREVTMAQSAIAV